MGLPLCSMRLPAATYQTPPPPERALGPLEGVLLPRFLSRKGRGNFCWPRPRLASGGQHPCLALSGASSWPMPPPQADPVRLCGRLCLGSQMCPREERGCPLRALWPPPLFQPPLQAPLIPRAPCLLTAPEPGRTPPCQQLWASWLPTGPELRVVHGRPRAPSLVPNAYRDACHWVSLPWSGSRRQPGCRSRGQPTATRFHSPCTLHLVPVAGLRPLEPAVPMPCHGQPGPIKHLPTIKDTAVIS